MHLYNAFIVAGLVGLGWSLPESPLSSNYTTSRCDQLDLAHLLMVNGLMLANICQSCTALVWRCKIGICSPEIEQKVCGGCDKIASEIKQRVEGQEAVAEEYGVWKASRAAKAGFLRGEDIEIDTVSINSYYEEVTTMSHEVGKSSA